MAIVELYSTKQKKLRNESVDVYRYDTIPYSVKVQIYHIIQDTMGTSSSTEPIYEFFYNILLREYGQLTLDTYNAYRNKNAFEVAILDFFLKENDVEKNLDIIQLVFRFFNGWIRKPDSYQEHTFYTKVNSKPQEAINDLNYRLKEGGVGYLFEANNIIRVDSTYMHSEIVIPVLNLLNNPKFKGANEEYLKAHEHYRHNRNKECLAECLKAFESVLKIICKEKGWAYNETDTSAKLIKLCFDNELVPTYTQNQFSSLRNLLESGIPPVRNKLGGHGQGQKPQSVSNEITKYGLNLTGTCIIFLIEQSGIN